MAELDEAEKNRVSHRARAFLDLAEAVRNRQVSVERQLEVGPNPARPALAVFVALIFKRRGTTILPFRESTALVTSGPFRYSRNPIYCGMIAMLIGLGVLLDSATPFVIVPVFGWIIDRYFIRREEADLETVFGAEYEAYKARVRRWL